MNERGSFPVIEDRAPESPVIARAWRCRGERAGTADVWRTAARANRGRSLPGFDPRFPWRLRVRLSRPAIRKPANAKPLKGFGGAAVLEVIEDHQGDTYRAVYTVKLASAVYVLPCFQKKSPRGSKVPRVHQELIQKRWRDALRIEQENAE